MSYRTGNGFPTSAQIKYYDYVVQTLEQAGIKPYKVKGEKTSRTYKFVTNQNLELAFRAGVKLMPKSEVLGGEEND